MPMLSTNVDKKIIRNRVFICHLSSDWRQMTIENTVSSIFLSVFVDCYECFDCRLSEKGGILGRKSGQF